MRKIVLAVFVSLITVPSVATFATGTKGDGTHGPSGGGNPSGHDGNDTSTPGGGGNPSNHDRIIRCSC